MNKNEQQAFEECKKLIEELLLEEKKTKTKLEEIERTKIACMRILLDDNYCNEVLTGGEKK